MTNEYLDCQLYLHAWEVIPTTREHKRRFMGHYLLVSRCTRCGTGKVYQMDVNGNLMKKPTYFDRPKNYPKRPSFSEMRLQMVRLERKKRRTLTSKPR